MKEAWGFQWIKDIDQNRHYDYDIISKEETPYTPLKEGQEVGFQWIKDTDENFQYEVPRLSKTLILSDGEYKRLNTNETEKIEYSTSNVIPIMTSATAPSGTVFSSGHYGIGEPYKAFNDIDGAWLISVSTAEKTIGYNFGISKTIGKYTISSRTSFNDQMPKNWIFEGSNDGANWTVLDTQTNQTGWGNTEKREYTINSPKLFQRYRVNVLENNGSTSYTCIQRIEMFEATVVIVTAPPSWKTVSATLPTTQQFQEEGMEDLSVFDRKVQPVLNSPIQMTSEQLGEGKVFKGKVDLKKYFDLRNLEIK